MSSNTKGLLALFLVVAVVFLVAVERLLAQRFEVGSAYAPYSTYRADPLGMQALYNALQRVDGITTERNLRPLELLGDGSDTTLFICNATTTDDPERLIVALEEFVASGGRLVVTFQSVLQAPLNLEDESEDEGEFEETGETETEPDEEGDDGAPELFTMVNIAERWGFEYGYLPGTTDEDGRFVEQGAVRTPMSPDTLPEYLPWHTALYFDELDDAWRVLYRIDENAVMMERPWEAGSVVLSSDPYYLSNEALRDERRTELVAYFAGPNDRVVFDETHLGVQERPGVVALARRFGLHGLVGVLLLVALLFVWQSAATIVPKRDAAETEAGVQMGRDAQRGLVNLLRRTIPEKDLIAACVKEWRLAGETTKRAPEDVRSRMQEIAKLQQAAPRTDRDPVTAYRTIGNLLKERNGRSGIQSRSS